LRCRRARATIVEDAADAAEVRENEMTQNLRTLDGLVHETSARRVTTTGAVSRQRITTDRLVTTCGAAATGSSTSDAVTCEDCIELQAERRGDRNN
jgi:hypothetical protein